MAYTKRVKKFRVILLRLLNRLAKNGCGDGGWCRCLLCRVMRIVQTEQFRKNPVHKSSYGWHGEAVTKKTTMVDWRGGTLEFANGSKFESVAYAPWYAIKLTRKGDPRGGWIYWLDYAGPPQLYLTRKAATIRAKQLRKQYKRSYNKIEVIKIGEI